MLGVAAHIGRMRGVGGDAGDPERVDQVVDMAPLMVGAVGIEIEVGHR
jgi:hypothetical protein